MKKIATIFMLIASFAQADNRPLIAASAVCVGGIATYALLLRESNASIIDRVHEACFQYQKNSYLFVVDNVNSVDQIQNYLASLSKFDQRAIQVQILTIKALFKTINNRYNSWLKPWNWTEKMKTAHAQINPLYQLACLYDFIFKYVHFIEIYQQDENDAKILRYAQLLTQGQSTYPMIACAQQVQIDLQFLKKQLILGVNLGIVLVDLLEWLYGEIVANPAYIQEKQHLELLRIETCKAQAAQNAADAQNRQARAQEEQARAMRESNDLKRQKQNPDNKKDQDR